MSEPNVDMNALAERLNGKPKVVKEPQPEPVETATVTGEIAAPEPLDPAFSKSLEAVKANKDLVENVTQLILAAIAQQRQRLDALEKLALGDCARVKRELDGYIISAEALVRNVNETENLAEEISAKRAALSVET